MSTSERVMRGVVRAESMQRMVFGGGEVLNGTVWFITEDQRENTWEGGKKKWKWIGYLILRSGTCSTGRCMHVDVRTEKYLGR
jgi:hypothetical protein